MRSKTAASFPEEHAFPTKSTRQANESQLGHGKFETLGALGISGTLLLNSGGIACHAIDVLQEGESKKCRCPEGFKGDGVNSCEVETLGEAGKVDEAEALMRKIFAVVTIGFVKDAKDHIDVQGFNAYHKNRLIKGSKRCRRVESEGERRRQVELWDERRWWVEQRRGVDPKGEQQSVEPKVEQRSSDHGWSRRERKS
ncbi:Metal tolerance protein 2 [Acorus calamus]|uniref:Metal tolerance protein 2 n=1 Tax=Acorus calamus TaxID=4465 RepID=A0AAV9DY20_ACOCL|nr:Metal tolerance protein 2 [Acorus calamus]